jgi:MFS transporter, UMF1 family
VNQSAETRKGFFARVGLSRPELRAWAMYDWAISSLQTTVMVAVFPIFFTRFAASHMEEARASQVFGIATTIAAIIVAVLSPVLGAISDFAAAKKKMLVAAMLVGAAAVAGMFFIERGDATFAATLFVIAIVGATSSMVFYEALLPHIAAPGEIDRVSTAGYAVGYVGGGVLLALNLAWIQKPQWFGLPSGPGLSDAEGSLPSRLAFLSVAVWWLVFSVPLLRRVREPARTLEADEVATPRSLSAPFVRLAETFRELRTYRVAFLMLVAFLIYNDGVQTIIKMATIYGASLGLGTEVLVPAILIVQFMGIPFTFLFGMLADRIGVKRSVFVGLTAYATITVLGYFMRTALHFFVLAALTGMVQGGTQALSRSLFATLIPAHKSGEFFGFFSVFEKFASIFGPLLFTVTIALTGSMRNAILALIAFFVIGGVLLAFVDVAAGRHAAREAEEHYRLVDPTGGTAS